MREFFFSLLITLGIVQTSVGQPTGKGSNTAAIDKSVTAFCKCARKAKDPNEFDTCGQIMNSLNSKKLSGADSLYILERLKAGCDNVMRKFLNPQSLLSTYVNPTFLVEEDLAVYNLTQTSVSKTSIHWEEKTKGQGVSGIMDYREIFATDSLAANTLARQKSEMISDSDKKLEISSTGFHALEVYAFEFLPDYYAYLVFARKGNLICLLTISTKRDDLEIIRHIINKLAKKVNAYK